MNTTEIRSVMKSFLLQFFLASEINERLQRTLKEYAPTYSTVSTWTKSLKSA